LKRIIHEVEKTKKNTKTGVTYAWHIEGRIRSRIREGKALEKSVKSYETVFKGIVVKLKIKKVSVKVKA